MIFNITTADSPFAVTFPVGSNINGNTKITVNVVGGTGDVDIKLPATSSLSGAFCEVVVVNVLETVSTGIKVTPVLADSIETNGTGSSVGLDNKLGESKSFAAVANGLWSKTD